jgi:hypothetical protein
MPVIPYTEEAKIQSTSFKAKLDKKLAKPISSNKLGIVV